MKIGIVLRMITGVEIVKIRPLGDTSWTFARAHGVTAWALPRTHIHSYFYSYM